MSVCILVEDKRSKSGKAHRMLATKVLGKASVDVKSLPRGDLLAPKKVRAYLTPLARSRRIHKCVVCVDSHSDATTVQAEVKNAEQDLAGSFAFPIKYVVVVRALESWLLEDQQAVQKVLRVELGAERLRRLANTCQPDRSLKRICDHFDKSVHDERIAQGADVSVIASRSPSFRQFVTALKDP